MTDRIIAVCTYIAIGLMPCVSSLMGIIVFHI
jgi:hypothetical protein